MRGPVAGARGDGLTHPYMDIGPTLGGRFELDFLAGLIAGFAGGVHCLAMCGGVAAALAVRGSGGPGGSAVAGVMFLARAQAARIGVYALMGATAGAIGSGFHQVRPSAALHGTLEWLAAAVLLAAAAAIVGVPPFDRFGARWGSRVTKQLHHLHRFGPAGLGAAWGLMPCSLVYITTFYAGLTGSVWQGALVMTGFGLGTVPAITAAGAGAGAMMELAKSPLARGLAAAAIASVAVASVAIG